MSEIIFSEIFVLLCAYCKRSYCGSL